VFIQILQCGGFGFLDELQGTKNGFCSLTFLVIANLCALFTMFLHVLHYTIARSFFVNPTFKTLSAPQIYFDFYSYSCVLLEWIGAYDIPTIASC
jgi:hypothetical protein